MTLCPFSKYSNIFGKPNTGVHSIQFMNVAMFDYILTIILAFVMAYITNIPTELTTIFCFIVGIICHILFGVKTNTTKFLQMDCNK
jgi:tetrahydromethanopterin S-methyltransferase subunit C